ncbi:MAG: Rne/Rng family ribonuclease [Rhodospirillaceae bacterium]|jgi:ribonuclease E|nr:Rne/Rng family ribonuclease [Rhodospirillaceae bacterium]
MTKRMLIDGTHPEETRVVITDGKRLEEYDIETSTKTQLKGNIYLAKVTRVEPSLQAAFVDYGGGRHGFLAFSEIHPDYYQIPIEDREALKRDMAQLEGKAQAAQAHIDEIDGDVPEAEDDSAETETDAAAEADDAEPDADSTDAPDSDGDSPADDTALSADAETAEESENGEEPNEPDSAETDSDQEAGDLEAKTDEPDAEPEEAAPAKTSARRGNPMRRYKIQEVIKRRQIILIQVVKEERGNKGAALTTYISLAGRYCVLMPNATRSGGGVSRKITSATDRRRLRDLLKNLEVQEGMGVIMRTAGMERNKSEIKRDFDYLMRLWENVRELTLESAAPALVYEEGDLIKRAIRDLYTRDIEEVDVEGTDAYQAAKKLMRMMMPSHAKRVQPYRDTIPLFHRYQVESQLESMHNPTVQLKSGGYIVIDATEALVAIDVNSGRSTKERNIEETAVKTNLEAASEVARQLRLRDLAGLIVIDFIDMEENRNQRSVEKRMKEVVKTDRARIQLGRISTFGLFELSRQRLRPSLMETSTQACPHCHGSGAIRSTESTALHALRMVEDEGIRLRSSEISLSVPTSIALYILNQKRESLIEIEARYSFKVNVAGDDSLIPPDIRIERVKAATGDRPRPVISDVEMDEPVAEEVVEAEAVDSEEKEPARKRRPRRRRKKEPGSADTKMDSPETAEQPTVEAESAEETEDVSENAAAENSDENGERPRRRRRGRRGGRRRNQRSAQTDNAENGDGDAPSEENGENKTAASETVSENGSDTAEPADIASPVAEEPVTSSVAPPETEPSPLSAEESAAAGAAATASEEGEPRRGWWQRIIE